MGALTEEEAKAIEVVAHYTQDEEQAYCMLYGEGVFDTIPIEARLHTVLVHPRRSLAPPRPTAKRLRLCVPSQADYTVGDMKLWLKVHKDKDPAEYDIVGPKGRWKMGSGSEVLQDDQAQTLPRRRPHRRRPHRRRPHRRRPHRWRTARTRMKAGPYP